MEFLDKKALRRQTIRLFTGYLLIGIAVFLATIILVYQASGYDFDLQKKSVIQNGLIFLNSRPDGANVYVNDKLERSKTDMRLVLPGSQNYQISLKKEGYYDWNKTIILESGSIEYLQYPKLYAKNKSSQTLVNYPALPELNIPSPDHRNILIIPKLNQPLVEQFDLASEKPNAQILNVGALVNDKDSVVKITLLEWSYDSRAVLLELKLTSGKSEILWLDRENPSGSQILESTFKISIKNVHFKGKHFDQFFLERTESAEIYSADLKLKSLSLPLVKDVISFSSTFDDVLIFISPILDQSTAQISFAFSPDEILPISTLPISKSFSIVDQSYLNTEWLSVASEDFNHLLVFKDPVLSARLLKNDTSKTSIRSTINIDLGVGIKELVPGYTGRFIAVAAGSKMAVYDFEALRLNRFEKLNNVSSWSWFDEAHISFTRDDKLAVCDFDRTNCNELFASTKDQIFTTDRRVSAAYSLTKNPNNNGFDFIRTSLLAE